MDSSMKTICSSPDKSCDVSFFESTYRCLTSPYRDVAHTENDNDSTNVTRTPSSNIQPRAFREVSVNTLQSSYGASSSRAIFESVGPAGNPPNQADSPKVVSVAATNSGSCFRPIDSLDSLDSNDGLIELLNMASADDHDTLPPMDIDSVISGELIIKRTALRMIKNDKIQDGSSFRLGSLQRSEKSVMVSPTKIKRCKTNPDEKENTGQVKHVLQKSNSMYDSGIDVMNALDKDEIGLIGDLTKPYCLPLMNGKHCDLTCISVHTMAKLLNGDYKQTVESYRIIDCRYPYEYNGGHIRGAENIFTHDDIMEVFLKEKTETASVALDEAMRNIVIFHCEFSSERGPKLLRFLRSKDREVNTSAYPALHYPEIYLLNDGYKEFFNSYSDLCDPKGYLPMLAPTHNSAYRHFRAETKTWNSSRRAGPSRSSKTRSRFVL